MHFPDQLCHSIAVITEGFSFAYMQEAFVASLLAIIRRERGEDQGGSDPSGEAVPWREMQKEVNALREGFKTGESQSKSMDLS